MRYSGLILDSIVKICIGILILWCLFWFGVGVYHTHPNAEDLSLSETSRDLGIIRGVANTMVTYDGRYFTNFLHGFNPLAFSGIEYFFLMPVLALVLLIASFSFFLSTILISSNRFQIHVLALSFILIYVGVKPTIVGGPFVMVGTFVYMYPWIFTLVWVAACFRYLNAANSRKIYLWFLCTVFSLLAAIGMNEMFLVVSGALLLFFVHYCYKFKRTSINRIYPIILIGISGILLFISSPGIANRLSENHGQGAVSINLQQVVQSVMDYKRTIKCLMNNDVTMLCLVVASLLLNNVSFNSNIFPCDIRYRDVALYTVSLLVVSYLMTIAYYIPIKKSAVYPFWVFNACLLPFVFALFVLAPIVINKLLVHSLFENKPLPIKLASVISAVLLLFLTANGTNNFTKIKYEYEHGVLQAYNMCMKERFEIIKNVKKTNKCWKKAVVPSLSKEPNSIFFGPDLLPQRVPEQWNKNYEIYFGIDEICLEGDTVSKL